MYAVFKSTQDTSIVEKTDNQEYMIGTLGGLFLMGVQLNAAGCSSMNLRIVGRQIVS